MKLNKLVIQNFMSVHEATLYLADKGLVSIEGENLDATGSDSNGSGKSTIINAILWCNYGEAGKIIKADSVVNTQYKKDCMVQCVWEDNGKTYRISRYRMHKDKKNNTEVELLTDEGYKEISKAGSRNVQDQINEILGQDYLTFQASCFAQQDNALDIPAMGDKQLKELLEKVLPVEDMTEYYDKATNQVKNKKDIIYTILNDIDILKWKIKDTKESGMKTLSSFANYKTDIEKKNENIEYNVSANLKDIARAKLNLVDKDHYSNSVKEYENKLAELTKKLNYSYEPKLEELRYRMHDYASNIRNPKTKCSSCGQQMVDKDKYIETNQEALDSINVEIKFLEEKVKEQRVLLTEKKSLEENLSIVVLKLHKHEKAVMSIAHLERENRLLEGQREAIGANPYRAPLLAHKEALEGFKSALAKAEDELARHNEEYQILEQVQFTYSPKGLRYHLLEKIAPELTAITNNYLNILADGAIKAVWSTVQKMSSGEYKEKFNISINMNGVTEYGAISGGEKRKVKLACFFALQDIIASKATKNIELWCGDEIDHALDAAGVERLMSLLDAKTRSKSTILVISHNELRDWIPNFTIVTRKDNISTISGYLNK